MSSLCRPAYALLTFLLALVSNPLLAQALTYNSDPVHSQIVFFVDHLGYSQSIGRFGTWKAQLRFDPNDWSQSRVSAEIETASIDFGHAPWNRTMCGKSWLDCAGHPLMRFVSNRLERIDEQRGRLHGQLTLRGVSQEAVLDLRFNRIGTHPLTMRRMVGFSASARIRRSDFGISRQTGQVGDYVDIRIELEAYAAERVQRGRRK